MNRLILMVLLLALARPAAAETPWAFTDITASAGTAGPTMRGETGGHGVMFADTDADGRPDLYITMIFDNPMADLFFRNIGGGKFRDEGVNRGLADFDGGSHGTCFADLDNDGDYDLVNGATWDSPEYPALNNVLQNDGRGRFTDVTAASGIPGRRRWPTRGVLTFDADLDGDLDIFCVTNYQGSKDPAGELNEVYLNETHPAGGKLRFTPVVAGDLAAAPCGQGATDTDFDGDGDIDVIAANRTGPVNILRNDGRGSFQSVPPASLGIHHKAGDGITAADTDNDGDLDWLLAGDGVGVLYANTGGGSFSLRQTFSETDGYMGGFGDLDNDGDQDLVFAGDDVVYLNDGTGRFAAGPEIPGAEPQLRDPRGIAFADIDADGDLDFAVGCKRSRNRLVRNDLPPDSGARGWLRVQLVSPLGQAGAFGAKVRLYAAGTKELLAFREARSNNGYLAQDDPVLHFGLGRRRRVDVEVEFLGGERVRRDGVQAGRTVVIDASLSRAHEHRQLTQWTPFAEWTLRTESVPGNPFDLEATAHFAHEESGEALSTGIFYAGGNEWKWRFTGARPGHWRFSTRSALMDLNGHSGTVDVKPNPGVPGFVTNFGNRWGRTGTGRAFVPQLVMYASPDRYFRRPEKIDADIQTFLLEHGFNGFHTPVLGRWFQIETQRSDRLRPDPNPDPRTFEALELLITKVHAAGGMVHIWAWGDESRRQTPKRWGLNGAVDKRLQRYIAARLGPLPGWTMGYGFDLWEWVEGDDLTRWHAYLHEKMGWRHMLGARAHKNKLTQLSEALDYASYEQHRPDYADYVETIRRRPEKPAFSEDRFRIRKPSPYPNKDYDMVMTRRGLWHSTMAGGVANIWGNLAGHRDSDRGSAPYAQRHWIKTYSVFFRERFHRRLQRDTSVSDGQCLRLPDRTFYVIYKEETDRVMLDLTRMPAPRPCVAVDTREPYAERKLGLLQPRKQAWQAPRKSDWALAVGRPAQGR